MPERSEGYYLWWNHDEVNEPVNAENHAEFWEVLRGIPVLEREALKVKAHLGMDVHSEGYMS